jgi:hypothetical protein
MRFHKTLRRLAMIEEGFVEGEAGLGLDPVKASTLDPKTAALLQVEACVAIGSSAVYLGWSACRALAAGPTEDGIAGSRILVCRGRRQPPAAGCVPGEPADQRPGESAWAGARPAGPARLRPGARAGPRRAERAALIKERVNSATHATLYQVFASTGSQNRTLWNA